MSTRVSHHFPVLLSLIVVLILALTSADAPLGAQRASSEPEPDSAVTPAKDFRSSPVVSGAQAPQNQPANADLQVLLRGGVVPAANRSLYEGTPQSEEFPPRSTILPEQLGVIAFESDRNGGFDLFTQEVGTNSSAAAWLVAAGDDVTPEWSPDGSRIVYASNRDGDFEIYVRTMAGQEQKLTNNAAEDAHPSWSPTGDRILFTSNRGGDYFQIYSMRADGSDVRQVGVVAGNHAMAPYYSPNGNRIVFMRASVTAPVCQWNWDVWTMAADGTDQRRVTSHLAADMYPRWSPDGNLIVFAGCRNFLDFNLYTINPTTNVERRLTSWFLANEWAGAFSTDNRHLAFSADIDGNVEIYTMPAGGGSAVNLTRHSANDVAPSWKPAGTTPTPTPTYTISGRVTDANGRGIPGVTMWAGFPRMTTTDDNGNYTFAGLSAGSYTITPSQYLYTFTPPSRTVAVPPNAARQDFVRTPVADLTVNRIEVAQVFVEKDDPTTGTPIPLIAKKDTLVRVYVGLTGLTSVEGVTARLHLRNAFGIEQTITQAHNPWPITVTQSPNPLQLQDTINFRPSPELLWGSITFWADIDPENKIPETNEGNNTGGQVVHSFQWGKPLRIAWTMIGYRTSNSSAAIFPSFEIAAKGDTTLRQIYPVGENDVQYFYQPGEAEVVDVKFSPETTAVYRKAANRFWQNVSRSSSWNGGTPDRLFAWVAGDARDPNTICGVADALWDSGYGRVAVGVEECNKEFNRVLRDIPPHEVMAHELGHLLNSQGLRHTPNDSSPECFRSPEGPDSNYPSATPKGSIIAHGLDIKEYRVFDPKNTYDFMSYCKPSWVSPFNYKKLNAGFEPPPASAETKVHLTSPTRQLLVSGMVYSPTLRVEFDPFYAVLSMVPPSTDAGTTYCLEASASDGRLLASRCFNLSFNHPEEWAGQVSDTEVADSFVLSIPYPAGTARIVLRHRGVPIAARSVSPHAPVVRLISPNGGETWSGSGTHVVSWTASDLDGDALHFALSYSTDGGASWIPAGSDLTGTQHALDVSRLPGGTAVLLRISATDGINTTDDVSDAPFTVGRKAPQAFILSPEDGARSFPGQAILLQGRAFDLEDGPLPDTAYHWQSNRDGDLGTGATNLVILSPGPHVITLTVADSDGSRTSAIVQVWAGSNLFMPLVGRGR